MKPAQSDSFDPRQLARDLAAASDRIPADGLTVPATIHDAIAVQTALIEPRASGQAGYKVAVSPEGVPVTGWLAPLMATDEQSPAVFPWRAGVRIEVEIAVRLAKALPPRDGGYDREAAIDAVGTVHLGIEILDSRLAEGGKAPYLLFLADRLGNAGYALGPELPKSIFETVEGCRLDISLDDASIHSAEAHHPVGDVLAWFLAYASDPSRPSETLAAGTLITTGSLCGALAVDGPGLLRADLKGHAGICVVLQAD